MFLCYVHYFCFICLYFRLSYITPHKGAVGKIQGLLFECNVSEKMQSNVQLWCCENNCSHSGACLCLGQFRFQTALG